MIFKDYYKILGLETSRVSIDEIKVAYRNAAKKYHPDVNVGDIESYLHQVLKENMIEYGIHII